MTCVVRLLSAIDTATSAYAASFASLCADEPRLARGARPAKRVVLLADQLHVLEARRPSPPRGSIRAAAK